MARTPAQPQVPGEVSQPKAENVAEQPAVADEQVTVSKASLDALLARVAALEAQPSKPQSRVANPSAALPNQEDVDLATLKTPVLTKQGWLVPDSYGSNPNAPKAF